MRKLVLLIYLACLPVMAQMNNSAIIYADQYSTLTYQQIVDTVCPSAGCTIYATSPNASRTIGTLDPGSKVITVYLGPFTYNVNNVILRRGLRVIGMGATPVGTFLQSTNTVNDALFKLPQTDNTPVTDVYLYGFRLLATSGNSTQSGILLDCSTLRNSGLEHSTFEDLYFQGFRGSAMFFNAWHNDNSVPSANQFLSLRNIWALRPDSQAGPDLRIEGTNGQIDCIDCHLDGPPTGSTGDTWTNVFIGNLDGGFSRPYSIHFLNLTSQGANVAVQLEGARHVTFIASHHEDLHGAYQIVNAGGVGTTDVLISNAFFAGNVGRSAGAGYLVSADNAANIVLDTPFIDGGNSSPPDHIVTGPWSSNVSLRNIYNPYVTQPLSSTFAGDLTVTGTLSKEAGSFKIDHPLDPGGKYLLHSFVESPDMMNIYNGVVMLDSKGAATVKLPAYFQALNQDFRYQLTCIGGYAPVFVSQEVKMNAFRIAGGRRGLKVSWQITGVRHDPYAKTHRIVVEEDKPAAERGTLLYPDVAVPPKADAVDQENY